MSLDLHLYDKNTDEVAHMNWLRNPFGLCQWAEDNVEPSNPTLFEVCNKWAYNKGKNVDRPQFRRVVLEYWERIKKLEHGFFKFSSLSQYRQFVEPIIHLMPRRKLSYSDAMEIVGEKRDANSVYIPMEHFNVKDDWDGRNNHYTLEKYKEWFKELVEFAELLQDKDLEFYCSN